MFCKFCGQNIPDTSEFCPECGKKLKSGETGENETHKSISAPLVLMLILLCWSTVFAWGRVLLFGERLTIGTLVSTVMLAVGLALLGTLISRGSIHAETYRFSDLLVLCCVWMVVPALMWRWESYVVYRTVGQYAYSAWLTWNTGVIPLIQFPAFWLVLGLAALGLARSGNWKPAKKHRLILLAVLLLRSALGFPFARAAVAGTDVPVDVLAMTLSMTRQWILLCWLWPPVILKVFRTLGEGRVGTGGAAVSLLGMQVGEAFLLLIFAALLKFGASACALANGLAPLFGLLALRIAARYHNRKHTELT